MNKSNIIASQWVVAVLSLFLSISTAFCSSVNSSKLVESQISTRINNISSQVDLRLTPEVIKDIDVYTNRYRKGSEELLGRVTLYFPIFEKEIRLRQLPEELKYIAIIESSLRVDAKSYIGASGLWQFMKGTGKMYGLTINSAIDERRDVEKATAAALEYLSDLYDMFGDWTVAIAAYNCGPGNVRKAIRKAGGADDYWSIRKYLPRETQKYVPKFIAASYLMNYYHVHELSPTVPKDEVRFTASAEVFNHVNFNKLSKETGVSLSTIKLLNPSYVKHYIPKTSKGNILTLPEQPMYWYLDKKSLSERLLYTSQTKYYGVQRFDVNRSMFKDIARIPQLKNDHTQSIGTSNEHYEDIGILNIANNKIDIKSNYIYHKLSKRESLNSIAMQYDGVSLSDLLKLNNIDLSKELPQAGSVILVKKR